MRQVITGIFLCLGFGSATFAHEKCEIRFLVDTPPCRENGYAGMIRKGTVLNKVMAFHWDDNGGTQAPYPAKGGQIGCFSIERGPDFPQYIVLGDGSGDDEYILATELGPSCYIDPATRSRYDGRSTRSVVLNPSTASDDELREERLRGVFAELVPTTAGFYKDAAYVYVYHPTSSCGLAARAVLEGDKNAVNTLFRYRRTDNQPDSCGPIPRPGVSPRSSAPPTK